VLRPLLACLLSGAAALAYQVLWTRQLGLVFGNTLAAVSTVLGAFMAGLGLGSALAARLADRLPAERRRHAYAALEAGIALYALAAPVLPRLALPVLRALHEETAPASLALLGARVALAALLVTPATTLMGATLPLLLAVVRPGPGQAARVTGWLYAANTLGAVAGSLGCALLSLPALGVRASTVVAAALNLAAAGAMLGGRPVAAEDEAPRPARGEAPPEPATLRARIVLAALGLSGLAALADEVAWTRTLILLIGPTAYAFAFVVSAVIAGLALGSAAAARWTRRRPPSATALAAVLLLAAFSSLVVPAAGGWLPLAVGELVRSHADRVGRLLALQYAGVLVLLVPPAAAFGAAFPLGVGLLARTTSTAAAAGRALAWNTAGAIAGSLAAAFALLPRLGLRATLVAAACVHGLAAVMLALSDRPLPLRRKVWLTAAGGLFMVLAWRLPAWDPELVAGGAYKYAPYASGRPLEEELRAGELLYYRDGGAATVSVKRLGGTLSLAVDGKVDATSTEDMPTQRLLAHVPLLLHPDPREVLVVGLGSGVTAGSALKHPVARVRTVEISAEVVEAARTFFTPAHGDAFRDPRLQLLVTDARNHLLLAETAWDVVISEPSNPWMAGVSSLFTRDFFALVRARLRPGGLLCQWAHIYNLDERELRTIVGGFADVFPGAALFLVNEGDILLVGGREGPPVLDGERLAARMSREPVRGDLAAIGVTAPYLVARLLALEGPDLARWAADAPRHTDDRPVLDLRAARTLHANTARANREAIRAAARTPASVALAGLLAGGRPELLVDRGRMLESAGDHPFAREAFLEALARDPARLAAAEGYVRASLAGRAAAEAEGELRRRAAATETAALRVGLGLLCYNLGRPAEAMTELARASALDGTLVRPLLLGAEVQGMGGNVEAMEGLASAAASLAPADTEAPALLAEASLRRGRLAEARGRAEDVLRREPRQERALEVAAIAAARQGERAAARRHFQALVAGRPQASSYLNNFGAFELEGGDATAAARLFEEAVDLDPANLTGYEGLLLAARALGDPVRARRAESGLRRLGGRVPRAS
jgi:spermidine synthase